MNQHPENPQQCLALSKPHELRLLGSHSLLGPRFSPACGILLRLLAWLVPDVPAVLATEVKRERYLAQPALGNREAQLRSEGRWALATPLSPGHAPLP